MTDNPVLEEYKICSDTARHLDEQNWMWGSFLFGGSIAGAGFVLSRANMTAFALLVLSLLSTVILGGYVLYVKRSIGVKDAYFSRMREIEATNFPQMLIQRNLHTLQLNHFLWSFEGEPIRLSRIRAFDVLMTMVICYLTILYLGTFILALVSGFQIP